MPDDLEAAQRRLNAARARQRRAKLGPPLTMTDADLNVLSTVSVSDMPEVAAFVRSVSGQRAVDMLEAR